MPQQFCDFVILCWTSVLKHCKIYVTSICIFIQSNLFWLLLKEHYSHQEVISSELSSFFPLCVMSQTCQVLGLLVKPFPNKTKQYW